jgi:hypothetical protein
MEKTIGSSGFDRRTRSGRQPYIGAVAERGQGVDSLPNQRTATFAIDDRVVRVRTPSAATANAMARLLPAYAVDSTTHGSDAVHRLDFRNDSWLVTEPGGERARFSTLIDACAALEFLVTCALLRALPQCVHLHAAGTATDRGAVLALGGSGAGKSSLALHWSMAGRSVFGDDIVLLCEDGVAHPFRRLFDVHGDRLDEYEDAIGPELAALASDDEAWFDPAIRSGWAAPAPVVRVAVVRFESGASFSMKPMSRPHMLAALSASTMPTGLGASRAFDRLLTICHEAETLEVVFGNSHQAAEVLSSFS